MFASLLDSLKSVPCECSSASRRAMAVFKPAAGTRSELHLSLSPNSKHASLMRREIQEAHVLQVFNSLHGPYHLASRPSAPIICFMIECHSFLNHLFHSPTTFLFWNCVHSAESQEAHVLQVLSSLRGSWSIIYWTAIQKHTHYLLYD